MTLTNCLLMTVFNVAVCLCFPKLLSWITEGPRFRQNQQWLEPDVPQPVAVEALNLEP
jgi:hypothetical protein